MRKIISYIMVVLGMGIAFSQNPEIKTDLPTVIPPSPTVANLMKFEEIPVSNYTGVPDISIPLFSSPTHSKDVNLAISLNYHPAGIGVNEIASDVGLGWSLFAGGSISRTVRGMPDEQLIYPGGANGKGNIGIYHNNLSHNKNDYYAFMENTGQFISDTERANKFIWETMEINRYDTEHDLWQFNFMGKSGRFIIKKNTTTGVLEVTPIDDYRLKIINNYTTIGDNNYIPTGFTIYDENGIKYQFDIVETTNTSSAVSKLYSSATFWDGGEPYQSPIEVTSLSAEKPYRSAFHLSKVYDQNNNLLIDFLYSPQTIQESRKSSTLTYNNYYSSKIANPYYGIADIMGGLNCFQEFKPYKELVNTYTHSDSKKLEKIRILDFADIEFVFTKNRQDSNILLVSNAASLSEVLIKDINGTTVKKYSFLYDYSTVIDTRMILKEVQEKDSNDTFLKSHELYYEVNDPGENSIGKDFWGYFNLNPACLVSNTNAHEPSPEFSTTDILQKIKYPTGGCAIFDFETNRFSYIGMDEIFDDELDKNPDNYTFSNTVTLSFPTNQQQALSVSTFKRYAVFHPSIVLQENPNENTRNFSLLKKNGGTWTVIANFACPYSMGNCCFPFFLDANTEYAVRRNNLDIEYNGVDVVTIDYNNRNTTTLPYIYGGGNRIKRIGYFKSDVDSSYYQTNTNNDMPEKEINFDYTDPTNPNYSSGSLTYLKPDFSYLSKFWLFTKCAAPDIISGTIPYEVETDFNNMSSVKTQGSDVGYKYVTIKETGNGYKRYTYSSPYDYPEIITRFNQEPPFLPTKNLDYKRGLLLNEDTYSEENRIVTATTYNYTYQNYEIETGLKFYTKPGRVGHFSTAGMFMNSYDHFCVYQAQGFYGSTNADASIAYFVGQKPLTYGLVDGNTVPAYTIVNDYENRIRYFKIKEYYGWAKLSSKTIKNYFYDSSNTERNVQSTETFAYNPENKMISEYTVTNSLGDTLKTKYFYHSGNSIYSQNRIAEIERIETYRGEELLSYNRIDYSNSLGNNVAYLPNFISSAKGSINVEQRIRYSKYDAYGNVLEVQQVNGSPISYIWGYHNTQPVAKIENMVYDNIPSYLITAIQTATDTGNEAAVIAALTNLRNDAALTNAMVTTITHIPLVGVSTITDPKGDKITYTYDSFGRLQSVKDKDNNTLSENQYHYKP